MSFGPQPLLHDVHSQKTLEPPQAQREFREPHSPGYPVALASAAHELKTPLSILSGYLQLLLSGKVGPVSEQQQQILQAMQASSVRLHRFVEDMLTFGALEADQVRAQLHPGNVNACLGELYDMWLPRFQHKGVELYFAANSRLPEFEFDGPKVQRVVSILLENAYAWTPAGGAVSLTVELHAWERRLHHQLTAKERRHAPAAAPNAVRVNVCDTGPGIAPERQRDIFKDFFSLNQFSLHQVQAPRGTGLGLAIARRLIRAQHGTIWVESEPGAGSCFCFLLPLKA